MFSAPNPNLNRNSNLFFNQNGLRLRLRLGLGLRSATQEVEIRPTGSAFRDQSRNARDPESFFFEEGADAGDLIALQFDGALAGGAAAAAGVPQLAGQILDQGHGNGWRKIVDHNHRFAAAMGGFASQYHTAPPRLAGRLFGWNGRFRPRRQAVNPQVCKRIVQFRLRLLGNWSSLTLGHTHSIQPVTLVYKLPKDHVQEERGE